MFKRKKCGCVKAELPTNGLTFIRCAKHRGKKVKKRWLAAYFDEDGIVRRG